jgi:drug/metabolite transporter (DMT)-like permease
VTGEFAISRFFDKRFAIMAAVAAVLWSVGIYLTHRIPPQSAIWYLMFVTVLNWAFLLGAYSFTHIGTLIRQRRQNAITEWAPLGFLLAYVSAVGFLFRWIER